MRAWKNSQGKTKGASETKETVKGERCIKHPAADVTNACNETDFSIVLAPGPERNDMAVPSAPKAACVPPWIADISKANRPIAAEKIAIDGGKHDE